MVSVPQHDASFDLYSSPNVSIAVKTTNHVSNPLPAQSNNPFTSPLVTLSESLRDPGQTYITAHDIIEAYNVISLRLRTLMQAKATSHSQTEALEAFRVHSDCIEQCLSRDIRRLLPNPFDTQTSYPQSYMSQENPEDDFQRIANNVLLCHYALRLIADIFAFPVVHVHFADNQLSLLLEDVVSICTTPTPVPNLKKLCCMIMLLLKSQQLPASVLSSCETHIATALKSVIVDKSGGPQAQLDAFQALHHILSRNPSFFDSFLDILPHVLDNLNTQPVKGKPLTTLALCGFASAKIKLLESHTTNFNGAQAYEISSTYIDEQGSRRPSLQKNKGKNKQQQPLLLPALFKEAFTSTESTWKACGPAFGVAVAASLIVLMDHAMFSSPRALKLIFEVIKHTTARGSLKNVRAMHPEVWRCLIWAYGRLPSPLQQVHEHSMDDGDESNSQSQLGELADLRDRAFEIVVQDLRNGTGLALLEVLLNRNRNNKEIGKAVEVVSRLVKADDSALRDEGLRVMDWLLSHIGADSNSPSRRIPPQSLPHPPHLPLPFSLSLLDGAILFQGTRKLALAHPSRTVLEQIPPLSEEDVAGNWACLCEAWICAARNSVLATGGEVQPELLRIWQALLLVKSDLTQHQHHHLTAPASFAIRIAEIINGFSVPTPAPAPELQAHHLTFIGSLWGVVTNVFTKEWLFGPAEAVLVPLLNANLTLSHDKVKEAWSKVCTELMAVSMPTLGSVVQRTSTSKEGEQEEMTRHLWSLFVDNVARDLGKEDWRDVLSFLEMPLGAWNLSEDELTSWESLFRGVVAGIDYEVHPVSEFMKHLDEGGKLHLLQDSPLIAWTLLSLSSHPSPALMDERLLSSVNSVLLSQYPSEAPAEDGSVAFPEDSLHAIGQFITSLTESDIVQFLVIMEPSLSRWIADELNLLNDERQQLVVDALYKPPLDLLSRLPPSLATLNQVAGFLTSVFVSVPGDGAIAFRSFWRSTYHICDVIPKRDYSDSIKSCLKAWYEVTEDSIGDGFSLGSEEELSVVSDSQPEYQAEDPLDQITRLWMEEQRTAGQTLSGTGGQTGKEEAEVEANLTVQLQNSSNFLPEPVTPRQRTPVPQQYGDEPRKLADEDVEPPRPKPTTPPAPAFQLGTPIDVGLRQAAGPEATTSKRALDDGADGPSTATKRRRIPVPPIGFVDRPRPRAGKERAWEGISSRLAATDAFPSSLPLPGTTVSEPPGRGSRGSFDSIHSPEFSSQPAKTPNKTDSSWLQADFSRVFAPDGQRALRRSDRVHASHASSPFPKSDPDYDSWERGVSPQKLMEIWEEEERVAAPQFEDGDDQEDVLLGMEEEGGDDTEPASDRDEDFLSPSLGEYPLRSRRRDRSQTAPEPDIEHPLEQDTPPRQPLRRHLTSPGAGSTSVDSKDKSKDISGVGKPRMVPSIAALQHAYAGLAKGGEVDVDSDSLDLEEILLARKLANQINQVLDEKIASKITSKGKKRDPKPE